MANNTIAVLRQMLASLDDAKKYQSLRDVMSTMNAPDLAAGRLVELCPSWQGELAPLSLVCADRRQLSPTVVLLREHLRHCCQSV